MILHQQKREDNQCALNATDRGKGIQQTTVPMSTVTDASIELIIDLKKLQISLDKKFSHFHLHAPVLTHILWSHEYEIVFATYGINMMAKVWYSPILTVQITTLPTSDRIQL